LPPTPNPANPASVHYPVGAAAFMQKNHLTGKILNEFTWGEYLIWTLAPSCQVAMDGRYETVYRDDLYRLHTDFYFARSGWHRFLEKYPPDLILVDPRSRVYPLIKTDPDWRQVYSDAGAAVFLPRKNLSLLSPGSSL
jgi:hypothetical protein